MQAGALCLLCLPLCVAIKGERCWAAPAQRALGELAPGVQRLWGLLSPSC